MCVCVCLFTKVNYTHFALQYPKEHALHDFHLGRPSVSKHWPRVSFPIFTVNKRWLCVSVCTLACVCVQRAALWKWCVWAVIRAVIWMPADCSLSVLLTDCMQCEMKLVSGVRWSQRHICDGSKTQAQFSFFLSFFVWKVFMANTIMAWILAVETSFILFVLFFVYFSRQLMVEKWTFSSRATALVDIPAVSMPIAWSLKTVW